MSSQIFIRPLPYIALLLAHIIWGANFVVAKVTLQEFPPYSLAFLRFAFACILLSPFLYAQRKKIKISLSDLPKLVAIGVFIVTLNITFFFEGIIRSTVINAAALTLIIPMLSVLLGWIFLKEKIYLINILGSLIGLFGALIIIGLPLILTGNYSQNLLLGNVLLILASVSFVIGATISQKILKKYSSLVVTGFAFLTAAIIFFLPAAGEYIKNPGWTANVSILGILGVIYMTLLSSISAYFLFEWGLAKIGVSKADLFQYIEPFVASFLAVTILGERISTSFIVGALLIALGVYLGTFAKEAHHRHHKAHRI